MNLLIQGLFWENNDVALVLGPGISQYVFLQS